MSSTKQEKRQTKREKKARKAAQREATRRAERRRNRITMAAIAAIVLAGGTVAALSVIEEQRRTAEAEAEEAERLEELEAELDAIEERPVACGATAPEDADRERPTFEDGPEQVLEEGVSYQAVMETSCGRVVLDLHAEEAPEAVNAFVFLAEEGFYDGLEIFRIAESIAALQTGSGNNTAAWDIGFTLPDELELAERDGYPPGSVALANAGPDTSGSQFFFVYDEDFAEVHGESPAFTRFADVVEGMDVLRDMGARGSVGDLVGAEIPAEIVYLESVRIERR